jgi:hypothetical protein
MDWFSTWEPAPHPVPYTDIERLDPPADGGLLTAWLVLAVIALVVTVMWFRRRVVHHSFWCATAGRDVDVRLGSGWVQSCSAFEDPTAIACARRCRDRGFRVKWPPALPTLARPRGTARLA